MSAPQAVAIPKEYYYHEVAYVRRLEAALKECAAEFISEPGTVIGCAGQVAAEFKRRQQIAADALA